MRSGPTSPPRRRQLFLLYAAAFILISLRPRPRDCSNNGELRRFLEEKRRVFIDVDTVLLIFKRHEASNCDYQRRMVVVVIYRF